MSNERPVSLWFCVSRRHVESHSFIPKPFILFDVFEIRCFQYDVDPQLAVGKVHENEQADFSRTVFPVVRNSEHNLEQEKKECHNPDNGVRTGKGDADEAQSAKNEQKVGNDNCCEEDIIECKRVEEIKREPLILEIRDVF